MPLLRRRADTAASRAWWSAIKGRPSAPPGVVVELSHSESVTADALEIEQAVGWARAHPSWRDDDPPFFAQDGSTRSA